MCSTADGCVPLSLQPAGVWFASSCPPHRQGQAPNRFIAHSSLPLPPSLLAAPQLAHRSNLLPLGILPNVCKWNGGALPFHPQSKPGLACGGFNACPAGCTVALLYCMSVDDGIARSLTMAPQKDACSYVRLACKTVSRTGTIVYVDNYWARVICRSSGSSLSVPLP